MASMTDIFVRNPGSTTNVSGTFHIRKEVQTEVSVSRFGTEGTRSRTSESDSRAMDDKKAPSFVIEVA